MIFTCAAGGGRPSCQRPAHQAFGRNDHIRPGSAL